MAKTLRAFRGISSRSSHFKLSSTLFSSASRPVKNMKFFFPWCVLFHPYGTLNILGLLSQTLKTGLVTPSHHVMPFVLGMSGSSLHSFDTVLAQEADVTSYYCFLLIKEVALAFVKYRSMERYPACSKPKWTAICFLFVAAFGIQKAYSHCLPIERRLIVGAVNGTLASFVDSSTSFSLSTRIVMKHFDEVPEVLKEEVMTNEGAIRRREVVCGRLSKETMFHLGWGDTRNCRSAQIGEFSHPNFTAPSIFFNVICQYVEVVQVLAPRWVHSYRLPWRETYSMFMRLNVSDLYRTWDIVKAAGIHNNGTWMVHAMVTNLSQSDSENQRGYLKEDLMLRDGRIVRRRPSAHHGCIETKGPREMAALFPRDQDKSGLTLTVFQSKKSLARRTLWSMWDPRK